MGVTSSALRSNKQTIEFLIHLILIFVAQNVGDVTLGY